MAIIAERRLSSPGLFLGVASSAASDVFVRVEHQAGPSEVLFSATGGDLDAFEEAPAEDPTIDSHRLVTDGAVPEAPI